MNTRSSLLPAFLTLSVALILCVLIFTAAWKRNHRSNQTISVTGSAKQEIVADLGILRGRLTAERSTAREAYEVLNTQKNVLLDYLNRKGFGRDKVKFQPVMNYPMYEVTPQGMQTGHLRGYNYSQAIEIQSPDVNLIKDISLDIASLVEQNVMFTVEGPEYYYTKLADIKVEVQAEAARDAMNRGAKIAEATDRTLGPLTGARMGVLQITPRYSNMISDYGVNDVSSIEKEITAVVNATFLIE